MMEYQTHPRGVTLLLRFGLYRAFTSVYGLMYLAIGAIIPLVPILSITLSTDGISGGASILTSFLPALIPVFATIGGLGVAYLFSTDRSNGVYEYMIATRKIRIKDIFISYSAVEAVTVSIILGITLSLVYVLLSLQNPASVSPFFKLVLLFSVPVAYFSSLISVMAMLTWSSLSKRYPGVNAPGGVGSIIGVIPPLVFLVAVARSGIFVGDIDLVGGIFSIVMFVIFIALLLVVTKTISNERMLG